ncbi:hypothetical protein [Magnetofaba australis]|uniref:Uncharacterized protein n=1 Tax=Magnetofaba australis IT-1 TaxID=1434232 RepID=A0A1Y2KAH1_9PROT|nr:hypothetical protein [Magnetofaba australis]OSM06805.1 hypothetical protein MAIT1_00328 [Magnetofaba australis IT-1]
MIQALRGLVISLFLATLVTFVAYKIVTPWNLHIAQDTWFYTDVQHVLNDEHAGWFEKYVDPFYTARILTFPEPDNARPVFVVLVRAWSELYASLFDVDVFPDRDAYFSGIFFSFWLMFLTICYLGYRGGNLTIGIVAATLSVVSPWALIYLYYPSYTPISIFLFTVGILFILRRTLPSYFLAGVMFWMTILVNSSHIVFIAAAGCLILYYEFSNKRRLIYAGLSCFAGFILPFLPFDLYRVLFCENKDLLDGPLFTLAKYYRRSILHNKFGSVVTPYYTFYLWTLLKYASWTAWAFVTGGLAYALTALARRKLGERTFDLPKALLLVSFVGIFLIEVRHSVQFPRSYYIVYPMILLGLLLILQQKFGAKRYFPHFLAALMAIHLVEAGVRIQEQHTAFHQFSQDMQELTAPDEMVAMLDQDLYGHYELLQQVLEDDYLKPTDLVDPLRHSNNIQKFIFLDSLDELADLREVRYFLTGPRVMNKLAGTIEDVDKLIADFNARQNRVRLVLAHESPYFEIYPLYLFEDEMQQYRMLQKKLWGPDAYKGKAGAVSIWRIEHLQ